MELTHQRLLMGVRTVPDGGVCVYVCVCVLGAENGANGGNNSPSGAYIGMVMRLSGPLAPLLGVVIMSHSIAHGAVACYRENACTPRSLEPEVVVSFRAAWVGGWRRSMHPAKCMYMCWSPYVKYVPVRTEQRLISSPPCYVNHHFTVTITAQSHSPKPQPKAITRGARALAGFCGRQIVALRLYGYVYLEYLGHHRAA